MRLCGLPANFGRVQALGALLDAGADGEAKDNDGTTALMFAHEGENRRRWKPCSAPG